MAKFNAELRLKVILEYLSSISSTTLSHKYEISGNDTVPSWAKYYRRYGIHGLVEKYYDKGYSFEYKLKVLNWIKTKHKSYPETALHFDIASPLSIFV